jgi:F-type H+-transporting ATPase subunit delta
VARAVARRYARALADILFATPGPPEQQRQQVQQMKLELESFAALLRRHADLRHLLENPAISREKKRKVLEGLQRLGQWSPMTRNFLGVLVENRRLDNLDEVREVFAAEASSRLGVVPVEVTSAAELPGRERRELEERLAALTGAKVELHFREDPKLLAGVVARIGSTVYDGSLRAQLRRLEARLTRD